MTLAPTQQHPCGKYGSLSMISSLSASSLIGSFSYLFHLSKQQKYIHTTMRQEEILDMIEVLCLQEEKGYQKCDYLADAQVRVPLHCQESLMDETCRSGMVQWTNNLVDFCHYNRETAAIVISCFDCFLSSPEGSKTLMNSLQFQLAAMTAFYTTAKVHERQAIDPFSIAKLSRGAHSEEAVVQMELYLLKALQWRVNPPTAMRFAELFLELIPREMIDDHRRMVVMDLVRFQLDVSLYEYRLSLQRSSHLGLAALMNALVDQNLFDETTMPMIQFWIGTLLPSYREDTLMDIKHALTVAVLSRPGVTAASPVTVLESSLRSIPSQDTRSGISPTTPKVSHSLVSPTVVTLNTV